MSTTESQEAPPSEYLPSSYHLPPELWEQIFSYCLDDHTTLLALLRVSSQFYIITHNLLYTHVYITHPNQITALMIHGVAFRHAMFPPPDMPVPNPSEGPPPAPRHPDLIPERSIARNAVIPRTIEIEPSQTVVLPSGVGKLFKDLCGLMMMDLNDPTEGGQSYGDRLEAQGLPRKISLDLFRLRVNSYSREGDMHSLALMFSYVNTKRFIWTGCDPSHHFSISIVPTAVIELFDGLSRTDGLVYLKLTHVSFARERPRSSGPPGGPRTPRLVPIPSLEEVVIGQATDVSPRMVVEFVMDPRMTRLRRVSLIDVYTGSIWGPRLRHSDLVAALESMEATPGSPAGQSEMLPEKLRRLEEIVKCEARTERIIGGDRAESAVI